jgi:AbrB family looped-hinge helix DNA binding protein
MVKLNIVSLNSTDRSSTMPTVVTSTKGQVVIPKKERERLGIKPGTRVVVVAVDDHIEIRPVPEDPVEHFHGFFKQGPSLIRTLLDERRKERRRENKKRS